MGEGQGAGLVTERSRVLKSFSAQSKWVTGEGPPCVPKGAHPLPGTVSQELQGTLSLLDSSTDVSRGMLGKLRRAGGGSGGRAVGERRAGHFSIFCPSLLQPKSSSAAGGKFLTTPCSYTWSSLYTLCLSSSYLPKKRD